MNLRRFLLAIVVMLGIILAYFVGMNILQPKLTTINAKDIESIMLVTGADQRAYNCSFEQIKAFTDAFNLARHYRNDVGTTPPAQVDVSFDDGTQLTIWGYNQGFATLKSANGLQQNLRGKALEEWFRNIIADQT